MLTGRREGAPTASAIALPPKYFTSSKPFRVSLKNTRQYSLTIFIKSMPHPWSIDMWPKLAIHNKEFVNQLVTFFIEKVLLYDKSVDLDGVPSDGNWFSFWCKLLVFLRPVTNNLQPRALSSPVLDRAILEDRPWDMFISVSPGPGIVSSAEGHLVDQDCAILQMRKQSH